MPKALVELERTRLRWTEIAQGRCSLEQDGLEYLESINTANHGNFPAFSLTHVDTGDVYEYAEPVMPWQEPRDLCLEPGEVLTQQFATGERFTFPSPGVYDLRVRYRWFAEGEWSGTQSAPLRIEVVPLQPRRFATATGSGSVGAGVVYCAWVDDGADGNPGLWLSTFDASWRANFTRVQRLVDVPGDIQPTLSVPANTSPRAQYVAWIEGTVLHYVAHTYGNVKHGERELCEEGYRVVPPLLVQEASGVEVLLLRENAATWDIRKLTLDGHENRMCETQMKGICPNHARALFRSDGERHLVLLTHSTGPDTARLQVSSWHATDTLPSPRLLAAWTGTVMAHDVRLAPDDRVIGTTLLLNQENDEAVYTMHCWSMLNDGTFVDRPATLPFQDGEEQITSALLRGSASDEWAMVIRLKSGRLFLARRGGRMDRLRPELERPPSIADILFVERTEPALLYAEPACGWRVAFAGAPPRYIPPNGG